MKLYIPSTSSSSFFFFLLFCFAQSRSSANSLLPAEQYWQTVLPNTPTPKSFQELLQPADTGNRSTSPDIWHHVLDDEDPVKYGDYDVPKHYAVKPSGKFDEITSSNITVFFLYKDLHPGKRVNLRFSKFPNTTRFLPRQVANSIPFSSDKLPETLRRFAINTTSREAYFMQRTIVDCEAPALKREDRSCPTSLESLVDCGVSKLGRNVMILYNEIEKENNKQQEYKILMGTKMMGDKQIVCHRKIYAYVVFLCHTMSATKAYTVPLLASDGTKAKAVVICHFNTSDCNPKYPSFKFLNVKPGGPPICHFLRSDTIVWVPN